METLIHPMTVVEAGAELGTGVRIGPFCHIGAEAVIGDGVELVGHVTVLGATTIGAGCKVFPQAVLGAPPQNARHKGGRTTLRIGRNCTIREAVTIHTGSDISRGETVVGDNGTFLAYTHIAHDCVIGTNATFANAATLAGHCDIGDHVNIGGLTALHQFVRIGDGAFVAGCSAVLGDVIPYGMVAGNRAELRGLNIIGMKRSGRSRAEIHAVRKAYRMIFDRSQPLAQNLARARLEFAEFELVGKIIDFMEERGKRQFTLPAAGPLSDDGADDED
jgi:UDP-N-acetylglucosamine acyltransferase